MSRIVAVIGAERPRHGAGDGVAEERRQQHRDERRAGELRVERAQEPQALGPRPQDERDRLRRAPFGAGQRLRRARGTPRRRARSVT